MKTTTVALGLGLLTTACVRHSEPSDGAQPPKNEACGWPSGKAAVSLTYDDSAPTQLSVAAPALAQHGLRATFFVQDVRSNAAAWARLLEEGHELGAHTFLHPCPAFHDWVEPANASEAYDLARLGAELDAQLEMLAELGQLGPYTFAYPCGVQWVGEAQESYVPLIEERFIAARGVQARTAGRTPPMFDVPTFFLKTTGDDLIATLEEARREHSWVVLGFHGIGGDWETLSASAHETLLQYLDEHRDEFYVAPFGEIAACL